MLKERSDIEKLHKLKESLNQWTEKTSNSFKYTKYEKNSESLYRFGWFFINDYKYSISGWKFGAGIITFENEANGEKIKYNIGEQSVIGKEFTKDSWIEKVFKTIRYKLSHLLRTWSDKLQP